MRATTLLLHMSSCRDAYWEMWVSCILIVNIWSNTGQKFVLLFKEVADYGVTIFSELYRSCHYNHRHRHHHHHHHHHCGCFFSTKEIRFSLPTLRHASSMGDLLPGDNDADSDHDTDSLVPASAAHTQRSHSFSKFSSDESSLNPYPTAVPYGNGMVLHFYQQQESSTTKTVHKVINKRLKTYV